MSQYPHFFLNSKPTTLTREYHTTWYRLNRKEKKSCWEVFCHTWPIWYALLIRQYVSDVPADLFMRPFNYPIFLFRVWYSQMVSNARYWCEVSRVYAQIALYAIFYILRQLAHTPSTYETFCACADFKSRLRNFHYTLASNSNEACSLSLAFLLSLSLL